MRSRDVGALTDPRSTTPEQRFTARLAAGPIAPARPLPARFSALARAVTGRAPRYRTGTAVRAALGAAGAHAATVDGTLHLPAPPDDSPRTFGVIAHELSHVAEPARHRHHTTGATRHGPPRFFLDRVPGVLDAGERQARRLGEQVRERAAQAVPLPSLAEHPGIPGVAGLGNLVPDVASLPVGGPAAALSAARQAGRDAGGHALSGAADALGALPTAATVPSELTDRIGVPGAVQQVTSAAGAGPYAALATGETAAAARGAAGGAGTIDAVIGTATSAIGDADGRIGILLEALEERVLAELERRGGRYAGVF